LDEHAPANAARDNNMRAAVIHVLADAAVSVPVIAGLQVGARIRLAVDR
jgi:Co/Zn/Cd efflux system component